MFSVIFPGQGSQIVGMGKELHSKFEIVRELFNKADEVLGFPISNLILKGPKDQLDLTENTPHFEFMCVFIKEILWIVIQKLQNPMLAMKKFNLQWSSSLQVVVK